MIRSFQINITVNNADHRIIKSWPRPCSVARSRGRRRSAAAKKKKIRGRKKVVGRAKELEQVVLVLIIKT
jgi:hypothetical protein